MSKRKIDFLVATVFILKPKLIKQFVPVISWLKRNVPQNYNGHGKWRAIYRRIDSYTITYSLIIHFEKLEDAALFKLFWQDEIT
jgi:hypothetical protein